MLVPCIIDLPDGYEVIEARLFDGITLSIEWGTPSGIVFSSVDDVPENDPALWQDMLEQVQIYVRMKERNRAGTDV